MLNIPAIFSAGLLAAASVSAQNSTKKYECYDGLKIFVGRGTSEPITLNGGQGLTGTLTKNITEKIENSHAEGILYPATHDEPSYFQSNANGTMLVREAVLGYAKDCPDNKMALIGYSQGAQIMSNNFCGMPAIWALYAGLDPFTQMDDIRELASPLPEEAFKNVVAFVMFGDTTFKNHTSYNYGTYNNTGNGIFYREDTDKCQEWLGSRMRSYCDAGDPFCDVGEYIDVGIHVQYLDNHGDEVAKFVVDQFENGGKMDGEPGQSDEAEGNGDGDNDGEDGVPGQSAAFGLVPTSTLALMSTAFVVGVL